MHSSSRNGAKVIWLGVHTTEGIMRAADLRDWTSWAGSSHASSDETGALLTPDDGFVPYDRAAWTLRNGNPISENIEQCGWARWTREEWLSRPKLLDATARWLGERAVARGIPLVKLTPAEVTARKPGVLGHNDYSVGTGDGTHWDPGPGYPWDVVLAKAVAYRDGTVSEEDTLMALSEQQQKTLIHDAANARAAATNTQSAVGRMELKLWKLESMMAGLAKVAAGGSDLTEQQVVDAAKAGASAGLTDLVDVVRQVVVEALGEDNTGQADEIVDRLASRLATP